MSSFSLLTSTKSSDLGILPTSRDGLIKHPTSVLYRVPGVREGRGVENLDGLEDAGCVQVGDGLSLRVSVQLFEHARHSLTGRGVKLL